jgi:hypothetical protein
VTTARPPATRKRHPARTPRQAGLPSSAARPLRLVFHSRTASASGGQRSPSGEAPDRRRPACVSSQRAGSTATSQRRGRPSAAAGHGVPVRRRPPPRCDRSVRGRGYPGDPADAETRAPEDVSVARVLRPGRDVAEKSPSHDGDCAGSTGRFHPRSSDPSGVRTAGHARPSGQPPDPLRQPLPSPLAASQKIVCPSGPERRPALSGVNAGERPGCVGLPLNDLTGSPRGSGRNLSREATGCRRGKTPGNGGGARLRSFPVSRRGGRLFTPAANRTCRSAGSHMERFRAPARRVVLAGPRPSAPVGGGEQPEGTRSASGEKARESSVGGTRADHPAAGGSPKHERRRPAAGATSCRQVTGRAKWDSLPEA